MDHCKQLWEDILGAGRNAAAPAHFIGPIVYIEEKPNQASQMSEYLVIDGQQRLTTVMLILEALARKIGNNDVEGLSAEKIRNYYLTNPVRKKTMTNTRCCSKTWTKIASRQL